MKASVFSIILIIASMQILVSQSLQDLEATGLSEGSFVFDYQLHRNPSQIYRYLMRIDSTKNLRLSHLYRGSVIYGFKETPTPSSRYKLDIQLEPYYNSRFGDEDDPFRTQIGIGPKVQINLLSGFYASIQWLIPIQNDFDKSLGFGHRPGELGLGYTKILKQRHHINAFVGTFTNRQYGFGTDYIFRNSSANIYLGSSLYFTSDYVFVGNSYIRERLNYLSGNIFAAYHFKSSNVTIKLTAERFLHDDLGVGGEIYRQFGNTDIGFFALKGKNGENAGFKVAFALWPRKFYNNSWMQVRVPHTLGLQYDIINATQSVNQVRPQTDFFYEILRFNPNYIKNHL